MIWGKEYKSKVILGKNKKKCLTSVLHFSLSNIYATGLTWSNQTTLPFLSSHLFHRLSCLHKDFSKLHSVLSLLLPDNASPVHGQGCSTPGASSDPTLIKKKKKKFTILGLWPAFYFQRVFEKDKRLTFVSVRRGHVHWAKCAWLWKDQYKMAKENLGRGRWARPRGCGWGRMSSTRLRCCNQGKEGNKIINQKSGRRHLVDSNVRRTKGDWFMWYHNDGIL